MILRRSPDGIPHPTHPHKVLDKFTADLQTSGLLEWLSEDADDDFDIKPQNQAEPAKAAKEKAQPGGNSKRKLLAHAEKPKNKSEAAVIQSLRAALDTCHRQVPNLWLFTMYIRSGIVSSSPNLFWLGSLVY